MSYGGAAVIRAIDNIRRLNHGLKVKIYQRKERNRLRRKLSHLQLNEEEMQILDEMSEQTHSNHLDQSDMTCPECNFKMCSVEVKSEVFSYCVLCSSCWFPYGILKRFTETLNDVPADDLKSRPSQYNCPICFKKMEEQVYLRKHNLLVDQCPDFHGVYLENNEFERALKISKPLRNKIKKK